MRSYLEDDLTGVRLVASDMDFTLLADDKSMPEGMPERIRALERADALFAVASGRPLYTLQVLFGASCDHMAFVSDNGGAVVCRGEVVFKDLIDDAIFSVQHGSMYRAERDLKTMALNYRKENNSDAEKAVERLL